MKWITNKKNALIVGMKDIIGARAHINNELCSFVKKILYNLMIYFSKVFK